MEVRFCARETPRLRRELGKSWWRLRVSLVSTKLTASGIINVFSDVSFP